MKNKKYILILFIAVMGLSSCEKLHDLNQPEDPAMKFSSTYPLSGEWWVKYYDDAATTNDVGGGYYPLYTSNTAADDGKEIWIWDQNTFWYYRVKCPVNMTTKTFSGDTLISTATYGSGPTLYDIWLNIGNGKVIVKGGLSSSKVVVDSIYLEIEFEDDPGTIYYAAGHRRTGFLEDEH